MADVLSPEQRHRCMAQIRSKNTKPELCVRSMIHKMGFRYRLHRKDLPGKPDLVFPRLQKIVFVHGCFWHKHSCKYGIVIPRTNGEFWAAKRLSNVNRDRRALHSLKQMGWEVMVVWECWLRTPATLERRIKKFLNS